VYDYRMIQIPPNISVQRKAAQGTEAAAYLQDLVNQQSAQDWEFYRVDSIGVKLQPGCLGALFGQREQLVLYYVVAFRRPLPGAVTQDDGSQRLVG
jgi:hypothetical protein